MVDAETGEVIFHNKPQLAEQVVIEVLIGFFAGTEIMKILEDIRNNA